MMGGVSQWSVTQRSHWWSTLVTRIISKCKNIWFWLSSVLQASHLSLNRIPPLTGGILCQICIGKCWGQQSPSKTTCQTAKIVRSPEECFFLSHNEQITRDVFSFSQMSMTVLPWLQVWDRTAVSMRRYGRPVERHLREHEFQQSNRMKYKKSITNIS